MADQGGILAALAIASSGGISGATLTALYFAPAVVYALVYCSSANS
ncbi:MAG: hypothetical protein HC824_17120 [Synechococcales cyanobacterium RM1_1_8]|nr:hypothetical protein [Synechococcales cyanobacterium RM1_1_8]